MFFRIRDFATLTRRFCQLMIVKEPEKYLLYEVARMTTFLVPNRFIFQYLVNCIWKQFAGNFF